MENVTSSYRLVVSEIESSGFSQFHLCIIIYNRERDKYLYHSLFIMLESWMDFSSDGVLIGLLVS
jgi:hypothetical protein